MPDRKQKLLARFENTPDDEFIGLLVHDLRGPLGDIISAVRLLNTLIEECDSVDQKHVRELGSILLKTTDNIRVILDAAIEYDRKQRGEATEDDT